MARDSPGRRLGDGDEVAVLGALVGTATLVGQPGFAGSQKVGFDATGTAGVSHY